MASGHTAPLDPCSNSVSCPRPLLVSMLPLGTNPQQTNLTDSTARRSSSRTSNSTSSSARAKRNKTARLVASFASDLFSPTRSRLGSLPEHSTHMSGMAARGKAPSISNDAVNLRVHGRGGQGSKPRRIQSSSAIIYNSPPAPGSCSHPPCPHFSDAKRQDSKSIIRVVGRGGSGSRPRGVESPSAELRSISSDTRSFNDQPKTFRVSGRGGAGSRPRPIKPVDTPRSKKAKSTSMHAGSQYMFSTDTLSTLSIRSSPSDYEASTYRSLQPMQRTGSSQTSMSGDAGIIPATRSRISAFPEPDEYYRSSASPPSSRSLSKVARTLGEYIPGQSSVRKKNSRLPYDGASGTPPPTSPKAAILSPISSDPAAQRSMSISSLPSISSLLSSPSRPDDGSPLRRQSFSTSNTEDLHWFGLEDRLSETWGEIHDDCREGSSNSPIMFVSSTPSRMSTAASTTSVIVPDGLLEALQMPPAAHDPGRSRYGDRLHPTPDYFGKNSVRSEMGVAPVTRGCSSTADERGYPRCEDRQGWMGEWNRGDVRDVIQSLRFLK